ncbi:hypothetical protein Pfo_008873, partial [Paulownia fortunei]
DAFATVAITIISLVNIIVHKSREYWEASSTEEENKPSAQAERLCRCFSLAEIQLATRNFSDALLIGKGGFGKVYKGLIDKGQKTVAVKRLKSNSKQGAHEFLTEIETLSELRHVNLVSLIGYCNQHGEMVLVYDYMTGGTLADHLYKLPREINNCSSLTWKQRLNICIGAGRGLDYLHTGHGVIHRDLKSSNILLDENLVAKLLILAWPNMKIEASYKAILAQKLRAQMEYAMTCRVSDKADVYSYGVVLLELISDKKALDPSFSSYGNGFNIVAWACMLLRQGRPHDDLVELLHLAVVCTVDSLSTRPTMKQVVRRLKQLQPPLC